MGATLRRRQRISRRNKDTAWQKLHGGYFGGGPRQLRQDKSMKRAAPAAGHLALVLSPRGHLRGKPSWVAL